MKTAILFSGEIRNYYDTIDNNYRYIIDVFKPDIFMSLWDYKSNDPNSRSYSKGSIKDCIRQYKPTTVKISDRVINDQITKNTKFPEHNTISTAKRFVGMNYQNYQASLLKQEYEKINNFKYDIVIRHRLDTFVNGDIKQYIKLVDDNTILVQHGGDNVTGLSDIFAIGSSKIMDVYNDLYNHITTLDQLMPFHPERTLRQWLVNINKIRILRVHIPMNLREHTISHPIPNNGTYTEDKNLAKAVF